VLGAYKDSELVGYGVIEPSTGDLPQLAVTPLLRRQGIASALLAQLLARFPPHVENVKMINVPVDCGAMVAFLERCAFLNAGGQYEMRLPL
jgi:ribosomal protein S18 acetylase RimI-like enzyme